MSSRRPPPKGPKNLANDPTGIPDDPSTLQSGGNSKINEEKKSKKNLASLGASPNTSSSSSQNVESPAPKTTVGATPPISASAATQPKLPATPPNTPNTKQGADTQAVNAAAPVPSAASGSGTPTPQAQPVQPSGSSSAETKSSEETKQASSQSSTGASSAGASTPPPIPPSKTQVHKKNEESAQKKSTTLLEEEKQAFEEFKSEAEKGDVHALYNLARCYEIGFGTPKDIKTANKLYTQVAASKNASGWDDKEKEKLAKFASHAALAPAAEADFSSQAQALNTIHAGLHAQTANLVNPDPTNQQSSKAATSPATPSSSTQQHSQSQLFSQPKAQQKKQVLQTTTKVPKQVVDAIVSDLTTGNTTKEGKKWGFVPGHPPEKTCIECPHTPKSEIQITHNPSQGNLEVSMERKPDAILAAMPDFLASASKNGIRIFEAPNEIDLKLLKPLAETFLKSSVALQLSTEGWTVLQKAEPDLAKQLQEKLEVANKTKTDEEQVNQLGSPGSDKEEKQQSTGPKPNSL